MTTTYGVEIQLGYKLTPAAPDDELGWASVDAHVDAIFDHLVDALDCKGVSIVLDEVEQRMIVGMRVESDLTGDQAFEGAFAAVRAAIHATNGHTPGWTTGIQKMGMEKRSEVPAFA